MTFALFEDDIIARMPTASSASLHMRLSIVGPLRGPIATNANTPELRMNPKDGKFCAELTYIIAAYLPQVPLRYTCGQA